MAMQNQFLGYPPERFKQIAQSLGFSGNLNQFGKFLEENPDKAGQYFDQQNLDAFGKRRMRQFQAGGYANTPWKGQKHAGDVPSTGNQFFGFGSEEAAWQAGAYPADHPGNPRREGQYGAMPAPAPAPAPFMPTVVDGDPDAEFSKAPAPQPQVPKIAAETAQRITAPQVPAGAALDPSFVPFEAAQVMTPGVGQLGAAPTVPTVQQVAPASAVAPPTARTAPVITATKVTPQVQEAAAVAATLAEPTKTIEAAQEEQSSVAALEAAKQTQVQEVVAPSARVRQEGEIIADPTGQAERAAEFVSPEAAVADPTAAATVQGQLTQLLQQFEGPETPAWARGAMLQATAAMQARGLGASSIAGQAIVDAAMRSALPIAQADATTVAKFEQQNLSNRQQTAMIGAQYRAQFLQQEFDQGFQTRVQNAARVSDIANQNFSSAQQIALENSRMAQTVDLANLSNSQALIMANASALAQLDVTNLNNRQQAAVQNAQNFLQVDMANKTNEQQTALFNSQNQIQAMLTDGAAENNAKQINAQSERQQNEFFDNLSATVSQFNAAQTNALEQFNAKEVNAINQYNSQLVNMRDQFNSKNQLVIEQSNAVWRREIATSDTAAANFANQFNAQNILNISQTAYNNLWQEYRDVMEFAWTSGESELTRMASLQQAALQIEADETLAKYKADRENAGSISSFFATIGARILLSGAGIE